MDMIDDLNAAHINAKPELGKVNSVPGTVIARSSKTMMVQKNRPTAADQKPSAIGSGIGSGIGGGLRKPTMLKPPSKITNTSTAFPSSNGINGHGISGAKVENKINAIAP